MDYLSAVGMDAIAWHEKQLTAYALEALRHRARPADLRPAARRSAGAARSRSTSTASTRTTSARCSTPQGVQVRVGHHCARPTCVRFGVPATTRVSLYLYNTTDEIDALVAGWSKVREVFA